MREAGRRLRFGRFTLEPSSRQLICDGRRVAVQDKTLRLLLALLERPGEVVPRAELHDALWPADVWVDRDAGLNTVVRKLRAALRELSPAAGELVTTVPRIGYRLDPPPAASDRPASGHVSGRWWPVAAAVGLALATLGWVFSSSSDVPPGSAAMRLAELPADPEARRLYLEARSLLETPGGLRRGQALLLELAEAAPDFAAGHAYLAEATGRLAWHTAAQVDVESARAAAALALELDPASAVAHRTLGMLALYFDWNLPAAEARFETALKLDPDDPINHLAQGSYQSVLGHHDSALVSIRRAVALAPESMPVRSDAGYFLLRAGRYREAIDECEMVVRLARELAFARDCLITAYGLSGEPAAGRPHALFLMRREDASEADLDKVRTAADPHAAFVVWRLERLLAREDRRAVPIATSYLALGLEDRALDWLERAVADREHDLLLVPEHVAFAALRDNHRYRDLLRQAGLT